MKNLCLNCRYARILTDEHNQQQVHCDQIGKPIKGNIVECKMYHPTTMPFDYELEHVAWTIDPKAKGKVGFKPPHGDGESNTEVGGFH